MTKTAIALNYDTIYPPNSVYPFGYAKLRYVLYYVNSSGNVTWGDYAEFYGGFASLAEYNAAVGLTYEPNVLKQVNETISEV